MTDTSALTLDKLGTEETGKVVELLSEGAERRRMLDLGILPGTEITVVMKSPMGDPTAYRIRDSVVALRSEQAGLIRIRKV